MFATLSDRLADTFKNLRGKGRLSEADIDATAREIRIALLEADVALPVARDFVDRITERAVGQEVLRSVTPGQQVVKIVNDALVEMLGADSAELELAAAKGEVPGDAEGGEAEEIEEIVEEIIEESEEIMN